MKENNKSIMPCIFCVRQEVCLPHSGLLGEHTDAVWHKIDWHADLLFF